MMPMVFQMTFPCNVPGVCFNATFSILKRWGMKWKGISVWIVHSTRLLSLLWTLEVRMMQPGCVFVYIVLKWRLAMDPIRFDIIGGGYRTRAYLQIARAL